MKKPDKMENRIFNVKDAFVQYDFRLKDTQERISIYVGNYGYTERYLGLGAKNINRVFDISEGEKLSKQFIIDSIIEDLKAYGHDAEWIWEQEYDYAVDHWKRIGFLSEIEEKDQKDYAYLFQSAEDWIWSTIKTEYDCDTDEGASLAQNRYNNVFCRHILPIVYHLKRDYGIEYHEYATIEHKLSEIKIEYPDPKYVEYLNSMHIDFEYVLVNAVNVTIEREIAAENGKKINNKQNWWRHSNYMEN